MKAQLKRKWSFSNLSIVVRIMLMGNVDFYAFFEEPEKRWESILADRNPRPPEPNLFSPGGAWTLKMKNL